MATKSPTRNYVKLVWKCGDTPVFAEKSPIIFVGYTEKTIQKYALIFPYNAWLCMDAS